MSVHVQFRCCVNVGIYVVYVSYMPVYACVIGYV